MRSTLGPALALSVLCVLSVLSVVRAPTARAGIGIANGEAVTNGIGIANGIGIGIANGIRLDASGGVPQVYAGGTATAARLEGTRFRRVSADGGALVAPCTASGYTRDCGWTSDGVGTCTPGALVTVSAGSCASAAVPGDAMSAPLLERGTVPTYATPSLVLRVCTGTAPCTYRSAGHLGSAASCAASRAIAPTTSFVCPASRRYNVLVGSEAPTADRVVANVVASTGTYPELLSAATLAGLRFYVSATGSPTVTPGDSDAIELRIDGYVDGIAPSPALAACAGSNGPTAVTVDCGWRAAHLAGCAPGAAVTIATGVAGVGSYDHADPMLRVCSGAAACTSSQALAQNDSYFLGLPPAMVTFTCPATGLATVMTARKATTGPLPAYAITPAAATWQGASLVVDRFAVVEVTPEVAWYRITATGGPSVAAALPGPGGTYCDGSGAAHGYLATMTTGAWTSRSYPLPMPFVDTAYYLGDPGRVTFACAGSAVAKCTQHLQPWRSPYREDQRSACVRMVRADYCGDGVAHTVDGVPLELDRNDEDAWDGVVTTDPSFEAVWSPAGARCVASSRVEALWLHGRRPGADAVTCPHPIDAPLDPDRWNPTLPEECTTGTVPAASWLWDLVF